VRDRNFQVEGGGKHESSVLHGTQQRRPHMAYNQCVQAAPYVACNALYEYRRYSAVRYKQYGITPTVRRLAR
jgi:hypothetical protein